METEGAERPPSTEACEQDQPGTVTATPIPSTPNCPMTPARPCLSPSHTPATAAGAVTNTSHGLQARSRVNPTWVAIDDAVLTSLIPRGKRSGASLARGSVWLRMTASVPMAKPVKAPVSSYPRASHTASSTSACSSVTSASRTASKSAPTSRNVR
ncbi:hypothetical protein ACWDRB_36145 [Nonomuraea sp. NPDC003707]